MNLSPRVGVELVDEVSLGLVLEEENEDISSKIVNGVTRVNSRYGKDNMMQEHNLMKTSLSEKKKDKVSIDAELRSSRSHDDTDIDKTQRSGDHHDSDGLTKRKRSSESNVPDESKQLFDRLRSESFPNPTMNKDPFDNLHHSGSKKLSIDTDFQKHVSIDDHDDHDDHDDDYDEDDDHHHHDDKDDTIDDYVEPPPLNLVGDVMDYDVEQLVQELNKQAVERDTSDHTDHSTIETPIEKNKKSDVHHDTEKYDNGASDSDTSPHPHGGRKGKEILKAIEEDHFYKAQIPTADSSDPSDPTKALE